jgi:hypothetical protein
MKENKSIGFTTEERTAVKARMQELKGKAGGESALLEAVAKMPALYRTMGERLHAIIKASAPSLEAKTWYGLPAYAKNGKIVCYMRMNPKSPFNDRYLTFGFNEAANLDEENMWPIAFALKELADTDEARIIALVKKAVS